MKRAKVLRRTVGAAGVVFWAAAVVLAILFGFQRKASSEQIFENLPEGWKVEKSLLVPPKERMAISQRLGVALSKLTNTYLSIDGKRIQVNILHCRTLDGADKVYEAILKAHDGLAASVAQEGKMVVELAKCSDVELMNRVRQGLGLVKLDRVARRLIKEIPAGWRLEMSFVAKAEQTRSIAEKLGGRISNLSNTIFSVSGKRLQVNIFECPTEHDAREVHESVAKVKSDPAFCIVVSNMVVEFVTDDVAAAIRAAWELGLKAKPKKAVYRISFDAAPIEEADYMAWNRLPNLFAELDEQRGDAGRNSQTFELSRQFKFGSAVSMRTCRNQSDKAVYRFKPAPAEQEAADQGDVTTYRFRNLPRKLGVPFVSVEAIIETNETAFTPSKRKPDEGLLGSTDFWPVENEQVKALASTITGQFETDEEKVEALLNWLTPGKNIRFAGEVSGSRYGVSKVLEQGFGRCWDFSDCFITLCRAAGIPSRQVAGWYYGFSGHIWAEVLYEGRGWQQVDPTGGAVLQCGIYHIPYLTSETGETSLVYVSLPKVEVLNRDN